MSAQKKLKISDIESSKIGSNDDDNNKDELKRATPNVESNNNNTLANTDSKTSVTTTTTKPMNNNNGVFEYKGKWAYRSPIDNTLMIFDQQQNQWVPEITDEMIKQQQSAYVYKKPEKPKENLQDNVVDLYVKGLPVDGSVTVSELHSYFRKAGFIRENDHGQPKIKIYTNEDGSHKGDALVSYARKESIPLAILQLDETEIRPGFLIRVSKAEYQPITGGDKGKRKNKSKGKQKVDKRKEMKDEANYGWGENENRSVVIKNLFNPRDSWTDPNYFNELQEDLEDKTNGCGKCGEISSITIFERNPEGVVSVKFKDYESAQKCVALMNGRFFSGRQLEADFYDGFTDYHVEETDEEKEERLKVWEKWLEEKGDGEGGQPNTTTTTASKLDATPPRSNNDNDDNDV
eukprot:gene827-1034_t